MSAQKYVDHMLQLTISPSPKFFTNRLVTDTHWVSHCSMNNEALGRFCSYKIMDKTSHVSRGHITALIKIPFTAAEKPFCPACFSITLHLCHCTGCLHPHCRWQACLSNATALLIAEELFGPCSFKPPLRGAPLPLNLTSLNTTSSSSPASPPSWCLVHLPHFNLIKVDFWYRQWEGF